MTVRVGSRNCGWGSWGATVAALLLLSMAPQAASAEVGSAPVAKPVKDAAKDDKKPDPAVQKPAAKKKRGPFPEYQATPANGTTGVDPSVKEIVLQFDRDMESGMSITGDSTLLPPFDPAAKPGWRNARTFVMPVKLAEGAYYRLGINSTSHQNFRSNRGTPAPPTVIAFTTKGASKELEARLAAPRIVATVPKLGAKNVDAGLTKLQVTFDLPMSEGMSFVGDVPGAPGGRPTWSADGKTITLPIVLEPRREYRFGLNSSKYANFQSKWGVPLKPVVFEFSTKK